jgi:transcriptional regulator with XRE-family HTH domain
MYQKLQDKIMSDSLENLQKQIDDFAFALEQLNKDKAEHYRRTGQLDRQIEDQLTQLKNNIKSLNDLQTKVNETTKNTTKDLSDSFSSFAKAVASSSNDISKFSPSVSGAVKGLVSGTGLAAARLTGVSNASFVIMNSFNLLSVAASAFAESLVKYTDTIIKTSDTTATIGLSAGITSSQLEALGRSSGFSGDNLINFGNLLKKQGGNLIAFGGNVSAGANRFAEFIDVGEDQLAKYRRLGISQLQLAEYQGMYADNLLRSGTSISRNEQDQKKLQAASLQYRDILYSLSQITGDTLEEQQKAQEFAQSQSNFNASMAQRDMERIAIEDRMRTIADGAEKEELQATIDRMNTQDAVMRSFASFADPAKIGVEHATAIFESLAAGGDTMSEAIAKMAMMGFDVNAVSKDVLSFSGTTEEGTVLIANAMKDYQIAQDDFIIRSGVMATNFGATSQEYLVSVAGIVSASQNFATEIRRITRIWFSLL